MYKKYLTIKSSERYQGSPADFVIHCKHSFVFDKVELIQCIIPNTYYNITSSNNTILFNGTPSSIIPGSYSLSELINYMITVFSEFIQNIVLNPTTNLLTITGVPASSPFTISFPNSGSLNSVLGFPSNYSVNSNTFTSSYPPSISELALYIEIGELSSNHLTTNPYFSSQTFLITNNKNKNELIEYYANTHFHQIVTKKINNEVLYTLTVKVKNSFGNIVLGLGEWSLTIALENTKNNII